MTAPRFNLHVDVDWTEEGWGSATDIVGDMITATTSRGFSLNAQDGFVAPAGQLSVTLNNLEAQYSRHNEAGPYFGNLKTKKRIRLRLSAPLSKVFWSGRIDHILPGADLSGSPIATITAKGHFIRLSDGRKVTPVSSSGDTTDVPLTSLFTAAGFASAELAFATGDVTMGVWAPAEVDPLAEARLVAGAELGKLYERADGVAVFENRNYRRDTTRSNSVQMTISDIAADGGNRYRAVRLGDPEENIFDRIKIDFTPTFTVDDTTTTIAQFGGVPFGFQIQPLSSKTFTINPFNPGGSPNENGVAYQGWYVVEWQDPTVSGGDPDLVVTGGPSQTDLSISAISTTPTSITFTLTNGNASTLMNIGTVRLRGKRAVKSTPVHQIVGSGTREYPLPSPYYPTSSAATSAARWLFSYYSELRDLITLEIPVVRSMALLTSLMQLEIGDRLRIKATGPRTELATDAEFFQEGVDWTFTKTGEVSCVQRLSGCLPATQDTPGDDASVPAGIGNYYPCEESTGAVHDVVSFNDLTRHGTTVTPGIIGKAQAFSAAGPDTLSYETSGLPDTHLNDAWEWNGWFNVGADTGDDQILLQKAIGAQAGYVVFTDRVDATHQYLLASVWNGTTAFTTPNTGVLLTPGTTHFWRLWHDPTVKTIYLSLDLAVPSTATYTGSIVSPTTGLVLGGTGASGGGGTPTVDSVVTFTDAATIAPATTRTVSVTNTAGDFMLVGITYGRHIGQDITSITYDGVPLTFLHYPFAGSGTNDMSTGTNTHHIAVAYLIAPSTGTHNMVFTWAGADIEFTTLGVQTFSGVDQIAPYSAVSYASANNTSVTNTVASTTGELVVDVVGAGMGLFSQRDITSPGAGQTQQYDLQSAAADNNTNGAGSYKAGASSVTMTWTITPSAVGWLSVMLSLQGASPSIDNFNSWQDEIGHWPERFLNDAEAAARYNNGLGSGITGGEGNSYVPPTQPPQPGLLPPGSIASRPPVGPPNSFYFATDEEILYGWDGTAWIQVAPGLGAVVLKADILAKGDLIVGSGAGDYGILSVSGIDGRVLTEDSTQTLGVRWQDVSVLISGYSLDFSAANNSMYLGVL